MSAIRRVYVQRDFTNRSLRLASIGQGDFAYIISTLGSSDFHTVGSALLPPSLLSDRRQPSALILDGRSVHAKGSHSSYI
ncbi:hypothetical protein E2C01_094601 [Portunus trituberculatus]|uniref:Uncharacterized protein n=1 Tax=Portunus trituberculatus TaxID=210409 RepID=A0A5B7JST7_PORTR|nr:hypothetical protein [Portunus trituberculatus]